MQVHLANADWLAPVDSLIQLVGANNLEIPVLGVVTLSVAGHKFDSCFLVKKSLHPDSVSARKRKYPVLLGCNILRKMLNIPVYDLGRQVLTGALLAAHLIYGWMR